MTLFGKLVMIFFLILVGTGVFFGVTSYVQRDAKDSMVQEITEVKGDEFKQGKDIEKMKTFEEFIKEGGTFSCDVTKTSANSTEKGVIYISDLLLRADFSSSSSIVRDGYTYTWNNATSTTKGYKTKKRGPTLEEGTSTEQVPESPDYWNNALISDYTCSTWKVDESLFALPKSIVFVAR